jgi:hypothetical protein
MKKDVHAYEGGCAAIVYGSVGLSEGPIGSEVVPFVRERSEHTLAESQNQRSCPRSIISAELSEA